MALPDVQQKNVTAADAAAAHAEPALTAQFYEPVDGRGISADNFALGKSPVNLALTKLRQFIAGLRGAVIGDFAGAVQRTVRSLVASTTPGAVHTQPAGTIRATGTGNPSDDAIVVEVGSIYTNNGFIYALGGGVGGEFFVQAGDGINETGQLHPRGVRFLYVTTGVDGANPPQGTPLPNELRALNIPKAYCCVRMSAPNVIDSFDGCGISSVVILGGRFVFNFAAEFENVNYTVLTGGYVPTASGFAFPTENIGLRTTTATFVEFTTAAGVAINAATTKIDGFSVGFFGRQGT